MSLLAIKQRAQLLRHDANQHRQWAKDSPFRVWAEEHAAIASELEKQAEALESKLKETEHVHA